VCRALPRSLSASPARTTLARIALGMPPCASVQSDPHERANSVLNAFLQYMRDAVAPPGAAKTVRRDAVPSVVPQLAVPASEPDENTSPSLAIPSTNSSALVFEDTTRETTLPRVRAVAERASAPEPVAWEEKTQERPGSFRMPRSEPPRVVAENSIIVDADLALTEPLPGAVALPMGGESRAEHFLGEMQVLIKYGHLEQVPREIDLWLKAYAEDLTGQLKVIEFEIRRVDMVAGLERLFSLAARAIDRRARGVAREVLACAEREAPHDLRVHALRDRLERV
jgi:hypothetical protein